MRGRGGRNGEKEREEWKGDREKEKEVYASNMCQIVL